MQRESSRADPMRVRYVIGGLLLAGLAAVSARSQSEGDVPTLQVVVPVVTLPVTVRDGKGKLIHDLTKDDFRLKDDGHAVPIQYFSQNPDLPLTLGLMVDTSSSQTNYITKERTASKVFFESMLQRPEDRAFLVRFDYNVDMLQPMTNSQQLLETALRHLEDFHVPRNPKGGGTLLYDALVAASQKIGVEGRGRKALVVLTDGDDVGSRLTLGDAVGYAELADTIIYSVFYSEEPAFAPMGTTNGSFGKRVLDSLAKTTGGRVYVVSKSMPLEKIFAEISEELRMQYQLGYTPPASKKEYHVVELTTVNKKLTAVTRNGYFSRDAKARRTAGQH